MALALAWLGCAWHGHGLDSALAVHCAGHGLLISSAGHELGIGMCWAGKCAGLGMGGSGHVLVLARSWLSTGWAGVVIVLAGYKLDWALPGLCMRWVGHSLV